MTVRRLRHEMPQTEFNDWIAFFEWRAADQERARKKADLANRRARR